MLIQNFVQVLCIIRIKIFLQYLQKDHKSEKMTNMSKNALKCFDQSNLNNYYYTIFYVIINNIFL